MVLNEPVVKLRLRLEPRVPPSPAFAPAADITPARPPGIFTVTRVFSRYPTVGVKTAASPWTAQWPAIDGDSVGIGELAASGEENCTRMGLVPLIPFAPAAGATDTTCRSAAGCLSLTTAVRLADVTANIGDAWLPGDANATIITPATSTTVALLATRAVPRRFDGPEALKTRVRSHPPLAADVPLLSSNVCFLRNHPDRDTAPSPRRNSQLDKVSSKNLRSGHSENTTPPTDRRSRGTNGCRCQLTLYPGGIPSN